MTSPSTAAAKTLGRYELVTEVTKSPGGSLWVAREAPGSPWLLARRLTAEGGIKQADLELLLDAAQWGKTVTHPKVARLVFAAILEGELGLVGDYHEGEPLRSLLRLAAFRTKPVPAPVALRITLDVLDALSHLASSAPAAARGCRYATGGLLPDQVLVGTDGVTRLLEPGVVAAQTVVSKLERVADVAGYRAPEQLVRLGHFEPSVDVFAVGVMLWEMVTGKRLFAGASYDVVVKRVSSEPIMRLDNVRPQGGEVIPQAVADLVFRALDRNPSSRFATATDMASAIQSSAREIATAQQVTDFVVEVLDKGLKVRQRTLERASGGAVTRGAGLPPRATASVATVTAEPKSLEAKGATLLLSPMDVEVASAPPAEPKPATPALPELDPDADSWDSPVDVPVPSVTKPPVTTKPRGATIMGLAPAPEVLAAARAAASPESPPPSRNLPQATSGESADGSFEAEFVSEAVSVDSSAMDGLPMVEVDSTLDTVLTEQPAATATNEATLVSPVTSAPDPDATAELDELLAEDEEIPLEPVEQTGAPVLVAPPREVASPRASSRTEPIAAVPAPSPSVVRSAPAGAEPTIVSEVGSSRRGGRDWLIFAAGVALGALLVGGAMTLLRGRSTEEPVTVGAEVPSAKPAAVASPPAQSSEVTAPVASSSLAPSSVSAQPALTPPPPASALPVAVAAPAASSTPPAAKPVSAAPAKVIAPTTKPKAVAPTKSTTTKSTTKPKAATTTKSTKPKYLPSGI